MRTFCLPFGAWLLAAPLFFLLQAEDKQTELLRFSLKEDATTVGQLLGAPAQTGEAGPDHFSWFLQIGMDDHHDYSHVLLFRKQDRQLVSVTRNYEAPQNVDQLFPKASGRTYYWEHAAQPRWPVRVRLLDQERVLVAMGVAQPGERTTQVLLIRRSALPQYLPWLAEQLPRQ